MLLKQKADLRVAVRRCEQRVGDRHAADVVLHVRVQDKRVLRAADRQVRRRQGKDRSFQQEGYEQSGKEHIQPPLFLYNFFNHSEKSSRSKVRLGL